MMTTTTDVKTYRITTIDDDRRAAWLKTLLVDVLPVRSPIPRLAVLPDGRERPAFDLDIERLHPFARAGLLAELQRAYDCDHATATRLLADGWSIDAADCYVI